MDEAAQALRRRARALLDLGRPDEALDEIRRALAANPRDPETLELQGLAFVRLKRFADALDSLGSAIGEAPWSAHSHYLYGFALRELGRHPEAVGPLDAALQLAPDEPVYLRAMAELRADLKEFDRALAAAARAVEVAPDRAANHVTYGYVASAAGKKDLARAEYERAVELDPADAAAWNNLGCLDLEAGQVLKARARFREALRLDPRGERAQRNLTLVMPPKEAAPSVPMSWDTALTMLMSELVRARADRVLLAALAIEAPVAATALVRGGETGAQLTRRLTTVLLGQMGRAALVPMGVGAAVLGAAWVATRHKLTPMRRRVRDVLRRGRREFDRLWQAWLDGQESRDARDQAIEQLVEKMAMDVIADE